jgi:GAF domain-containing protein
VINLESQQVNAFTTEHVNFLKALAAQAAIAIGNAQRLEEYRERGELLRRRAEQLTNLFQIGQAFRSDQALDQTLDDVVHAIQETVGFEVAG